MITIRKNRLLSFLFYMLAFLSVAYLIGIHDLSYIFNTPMVMVFPVKTLNQKSMAVQKYITGNINNKIKFSDIAGSNFKIAKQLGAVYCFECGNIPGLKFLIADFSGSIILVLAVFYFFLKKLIAFPLIHPPKYSSF
ncbi:MAG: hypothetical protein EVJ46_03155 [Candidatus Acididesulfobacter guangdongensis]|uniref:Uncharacterized protein n=1 Tax=Acididesulfobacter guangdongensis TaxID=2597225 RepID=A0A519BIZ9_ACIG2|nr:MAG: hypothetical protein EVJ46_03155 [Candidatus Acididesulfobacter guangdongensis]